MYAFQNRKLALAPFSTHIVSRTWRVNYYTALIRNSTIDYDVVVIKDV